MTYQEKYTGRLEALTDMCQTEYGIDSYAVKMVCAALIPSPSPLWLCVETLYSGFWADLDAAICTLGYPELIGMQKLQMRPRYSNDLIERWLERRDRPRLFLEPLGGLPRKFSGIHHRAGEVLAEMVRVRTPMGLARVVKPSTRQSLLTLLSDVVDPTGRPYQPMPVQASPAMSDLIKLVGVLNPEYATNLHPLTVSLSMLPSTWACLHGREELEDADWLACLHVMQGCIREWTWKVLGEFVWKDGVQTLDGLSAACRLDKELVRSEVWRLSCAGVLDWEGGRKKWIGRGEYWWMEVEGLIGGTVRWWK